MKFTHSQRLISRSDDAADKSIFVDWSVRAGVRCILVIVNRRELYIWSTHLKNENTAEIGFSVIVSRKKKIAVALERERFLHGILLGTHLCVRIFLLEQYE